MQLEATNVYEQCMLNKPTLFCKILMAASSGTDCEVKLSSNFSSEKSTAY